MLGNHLPRQCGIATFTTDLSEAISRETPTIDCFVLAMNDAGGRYAYPGRVRLEIPQDDPQAYRRAAEFIAAKEGQQADVLSVQHEFGIFGGEAGDMLLVLLGGAQVPIVTTFHTILASPSPAQRSVMSEIVRRSTRVVAMSQDGASLLRDVYGARPESIDLIPHGIPDVPPSGGKGALGLEGRPVILTFGLLSPDKGIEYAIEALPAILERHPESVYVILGATHPHVRAAHGESYRRSLEELAARRSVSSSVLFRDRFVSAEELVLYLSAADIYITPYLKEEQSTSGTLACAVGAGKVVLSTPYRYARDLLADGRGALVPWRDPQAIASKVIELLDDEPARRAMQARAADYGRAMSWPVIAGSYLRSFERARAEWLCLRQKAPRSMPPAGRPDKLPELNLGHLRAMTDDTGILQHAIYDIPRYEDGYCLDDNARALLLTSLAQTSSAETARDLKPLAARYLAFVNHALDRPSGRFRNFLSYSRGWLEQAGSEDSHGRALWALGALIDRSPEPARRALGEQLFREALPSVAGFTSPRAWAYTLLGLDGYLHALRSDPEARASRDALARKLLALHSQNSSDDWPWFEGSLAYCNARLSQALIASATSMADDEMMGAGLRSLGWLVDLQRAESGCFAPVGSGGFHDRGLRKLTFDQQPVEVCSTLSACLEAWRATGQQRWLDHARHQFAWFMGHNQLHLPLYDPKSGACRDGLHPDRVNENRGAESTISFLMSLLELQQAERSTRTAPPPLTSRIRVDEVLA